MQKFWPIFLFLPFCAWAADIPPYIDDLEGSVLQSWLSKHPSYRVATEADCVCAEALKELRSVDGGVWKKNPEYQPYFLRSDLNGDKHTDFAVVLVGAREERTLAIFNGPLKVGDSPAYISSKVTGALFFGAPRPKPYRLVVGEFSSEGVMFRPKGKTYVPVSGN